METFLLLITFSQFAYAGTYYPDDGDFLYDGEDYADSYMTWNDPGWSVDDPGYEHDLRVDVDYFGHCSTWTNLPDPYDDCPTAGVFDPSGDIILSFGFFHSDGIDAGKQYYGAWSFTRGTAEVTDFDLIGQEVQRRSSACVIDTIWCMQRVQDRNVLSGFLSSEWDYWELGAPL
jgi:hypothetical protein